MLNQLAAHHRALGTARPPAPCFVQQRLTAPSWQQQHQRARTLPHAAGNAASGGLSNVDPTTGLPYSNASSTALSGGAADGGNVVASTGSKAPVSIGQRIKRFFLGDKLDKERLAALGMGAFASYGVISNVNYGTCLAISWLAFVKQYGVAPTAPGQFTPFLAFYAGLWAVQNFARPLRLSLAIALAPFFDRLITRISESTGLAKRWSFGLLLISIAALTCTLLFGSLWLLGGFPPTK